MDAKDRRFASSSSSRLLNGVDRMLPLSSDEARRWRILPRRLRRFGALKRCPNRATWR
jgi:hypothetical protein